MLKESIPTASARTASSTALRIAWSPPIGKPDSSTVTGRNVSRPSSSVDIACALLWVAVGSKNLTSQTFADEWVFPRAAAERIRAHQVHALLAGPDSGLV